MNYYLNKQIEWFEKTQKMIGTAKSERHRSILTSYLLHVGYELVGENARLFEPDLMVEDPVYRIIGLGSPTTHVEEYRGKEAIRKRFYGPINETVILVYDETTAVADWGLAMFSTVATILNPDQVQAAGLKVDDKTAKYVVEYFCAERWPYDERGRLIGEEVYQIGDAKVRKVEPEDYLTTEQRNAAVRRFLPA